jgi:hypothetical protein
VALVVAESVRLVGVVNRHRRVENGLLVRIPFPVDGLRALAPDTISAVHIARPALDREFLPSAAVEVRTRAF